MTAPSSPPGSGAEFRLDVELAQQAVIALEAVHDQLVVLREDAVLLARQRGTANDLVSREAFELMAIKADGGAGSFTAALDGARDHVLALMDQMKADIREQQETDADAARDLRRS